MGFVQFYGLAFSFYALVWVLSVVGLAKLSRQELQVKNLVKGSLVSWLGMLVLSGLLAWFRFFPHGHYQDPGVAAGVFLTLFSLAASGTIMFAIVRKSIIRLTDTSSIATFFLIQLVGILLFVAGLSAVSP